MQHPFPLRSRLRMGTRRARDNCQDRRTQLDEASEKTHRKIPRRALDRLLCQVDGRIPQDPRICLHGRLAHGACRCPSPLLGRIAQPETRQSHLRTGIRHTHPRKLPGAKRFHRGRQPQIRHSSGGRHALPRAHQVRDPRHEIRRTFRRQISQSAQVLRPQRLGQRDHHRLAYLVGQRMGR